jgi:hypothetical protein
VNQIESYSNIVSELALLPSVTIESMKALIMGPNYQLLRYSVASEKLLIALGAYDPDADTCYDWPNLETDAVVDLSYTRLFIDDALLQYYNDQVGSGDTIEAIYCDTGVSLYNRSESLKNAIRATATNWKDQGSYSRASGLRERDVTVGDTIRVSAVVSGTEVILWSTIAGIISDEVAGVVGSATEDPNNISATFEESSSSSSSSAPSVTFQTITGSVDLLAAAVTNSDRPEHAYELGVVNDIYTINVTEAGVVGVDTPRITVTSESGTDDAANVLVVAGNAATAFGIKGVSVTIPNGAALTTAMEWEVDVQWGVADVDVESGGAYTGSTDTTYVVEVTTGASFAGGPPEVTVTTTTGSDSSGPTEVSGLDTDITIGTYGITLRFTSELVASQGLYLGDKFYVAATAPSAGAPRTLELNHNLPDELLGLGTGDVCGTPPDLAVTLYIKKNIEVTENRTGYAPLVNWTEDADEICVSDGIIAYDSTWVDSAGDMLPLPVKSGSLYVQYRALKTANANEVDAITAPTTGSLTTAVEAVLGAVSSDNPLSLGVYLALQAAGEQEVKYIAIGTNNLAGYNTALEWIAGEEDINGIVPLTRLSTVQSAVKTHVGTYSGTTKNRWRKAIFNTDGTDEKAILSADSSSNPILATIKDDPTSSGLQYTYVEITNSGVNLQTSGVQANDILRAEYGTDGFGTTTYTEYVVSSVLAANALLLSSGPSAPISTAAKIEIWRNLTGAGVTTELVSDTSGLDNARVINVWPDLWTYGSETLPGYYAACVVGGLMSTMAPHRSATNVELPGIDAVPRTTELLTPAQQDTLEAAGIWIITQAPTGECYTRRAVTTKVSGTLAETEEMIVRDVDSVRYVLANQLAPYKGLSNLVQSVVDQLEGEAIDGLDFLQSSTQAQNLGGQITGYSNLSVAQHATLTNQLSVSVTVSVPSPFGVLDLEVSVTV